MLEINKKYTVKHIKRFPSDLKYLVGKKVTVMGFDGNKVSVVGTGGNLIWIPAKALIDLPEDLTYKNVAFGLADAFVVTHKDSALPVGTLITKDMLVSRGTSRSDSVFHIFDEDVVVKDIHMDTLITKVVKEAPKKVKESQAPDIILEAVKEISPVPVFKAPSNLQEMLLEVDIAKVQETVMNAEGAFTSLDGSVYGTRAEALTAQQIELYNAFKAEFQKELISRVQTMFDIE